MWINRNNIDLEDDFEDLDQYLINDDYEDYLDDFYDYQDEIHDFNDYPYDLYWLEDDFSDWDWLEEEDVR